VTQEGNGLSPAGAAGSPINLALTNLALTDPAGGGSVAVTIAGVPAGWSLNAGTNLGNGTWAVATSNPAALTVTTPATFAGAMLLNVSESWTNPDGSAGSAEVADNVEAYAPGSAIFALSGNDTLTGSGANDVYVFARPIGNDTIDNFNPASDQIDLVSFANVASFADIKAKLADDANGNAVITLGTGETITIAGVGSAALSAANFLFDQEPVTINAGTMTIADGAMLPLGGTIDNSGTIALASTGGGAELQVQVSGVTLQGGGQLVLSDDGRNLVTAADPSAVLTNVDNTISGAGQLGAGQLTLDNAGVIDATGANALTIDTGGNAVANSGTLEATGSGGLMVAGAVVNSGTLSADGGNLTVAVPVGGSGGAEISGGATLEFGAASSANVGFAAGAAGMLKLDQSSGFSGTVAGFGAGDAIDLADIVFGGSDTLAYAANAGGTGGVLSVSDGTHAANLALIGQYAAAEFATAPDPGGGTVVTYAQAPPASGINNQALLAHPHH
jgi:hypothetical protein